MIVKSTDTLSDIRKRVQAKLQIKEDEFKTYKVAVLSGMLKQEYLKDGNLEYQ